MTNSIWNDLCKQPVITASTEKYTKLVHDATTQLHQGVQSILSALNLRAMALSKSANFESALRDAHVMQQLSPLSPLGYLRAASIYNEQGKRHQAVDICNTGLNVVDTNDPDYDTLQRVKDDAEHHASRHIGFMKQLPTDIITTTLLPLLVGDSPLPSLIPCPYLHVSNLWRDCILQCLDGLFFETGHQEEENDIEKCSQLIRFSPYIKSLHVRRYSKGRWLADLLRENAFCSLQELSIDDYSTANIDDYVPLLKSISSTLRHLTIHEGSDYMLSLHDTLAACPILVSLTISLYDREDLSQLPMTTWPNMKTLSIEFQDEELTRDDVINLCQRFPSLKKFHLYPCLDVDCALLIPRHCPLLKSVQLDIYMLSVGVTCIDEGLGSEGITVTNLSINIEDFEVDDDFMDISSIFRQHHSTLEAIEWNIFPEGDYRHLHQLQYPQLKKLSLYTSGSWILRNAPILKELKVSSSALNADPTTLNTIPPGLRKLKFKFDDGIELADKEASARYLHRISQQCILHEFGIRFFTSQTYGNVLDEIPRLTTLQRLMIGVHGEWNPYEMERFLDSLVNGCPYLSCLEIDCMNAPSTYSLNTLKRLECLNRFAFSIRGTDGYDSFWDAIRNFSQLKCIRMYPANAVSKSVIRNLKEHRRDMKVFVDGIFKRF